MNGAYLLLCVGLGIEESVAHRTLFCNSSTWKNIPAGWASVPFLIVKTLSARCFTKTLFTKLFDNLHRRFDVSKRKLNHFTIFRTRKRPCTFLSVVQVLPTVAAGGPQ